MQEYHVTVNDCKIIWLQNGKYHRLDGPAVEYVDGEKQWWQNGEIHRLDGPAIEYANGSKLWYQNGERHRTDGPAVECADGSVEYWVNGRQIPNPNEVKEMTVEQIIEALGHNVKIVK